MKRGVLFLIVMAFALAGMAQDWSKIIVGPDKPSKTELQYLKGVNAPLQPQIAGKFSIADGVGFDNSEFSKRNDALYVLRLMGSTALGLPVAAQFPAAATNYAFVDGTAYLVTLYVDKACTATGLRWGTTATASFTADNFNGVGLYSIAANGTHTKIAESANSASNFTTANGGLQSVPFTSPISLQPGIYAAVVLYNSSAQSTAPQTYGANQLGLVSQYAYGLPSGIIFQGTWAGQTSLPASFNGTSFTRVANVAQIILY